MAVGAAHTAWGVVAYHDQLPGIVRDLPGSVGDGIFEQRHSRDARASAFWFLFAGPLVSLLGRLHASAEASGDERAQRVAGGSVLALGVAGEAAMPRSGFPAAIALGLWMLRRAGR
jgi:hypothetical protein